MKKLWMGVAVAILAVVIGGVVAQKCVPELARPIGVLMAGLCIMIIIGAILYMWGMPFGGLKDEKGKVDKGALICILVLELTMLGGFLYGGVQSAKAIADIVNGPTEKVIYAAMIKERKHTGYRNRSKVYYLTGLTYDEGEKVKLKVSSEKLDKVKELLSDAKWDYGVEAKYRVYYFENLDFLHNLEIIVPEAVK